MTETEARDLIDKAQHTITETQRMAVNSLNEITTYIIDQKLEINKLLNEIVNLKCEKNDWKQRAESAEKRYESLVQSSAACTQKKIANILQTLFNFAEQGIKGNSDAFAHACNEMKYKIRVEAKKYGVEIKQCEKQK